ncbi:MAG: Fur family transcriptional regulator [Actinomycetota bacterium]
MQIILLINKRFSINASERGAFVQKADLPALLRSHGLRVTPQRLAVLETLHTSPTHLSAEEVFEGVRNKMPSVSLATVYNALGELRRVGQLRDLPVSGKVRYDLVARGPHHHLVCESCHRVVDLDASYLAQPELPEWQAQGFTILTAEVIFRSICPDCQKVGTIDRPDASHTANDQLSTEKSA